MYHYAALTLIQWAYFVTLCVKIHFPVAEMLLLNYSMQMTFHGSIIWLRRRPLFTILIALLIVDIAIAAVFFRHERGVLTVAFLNVGQGDAVFIEAPNGNQMLYDAGPPSGAVLRELGRVMPFYDRSIDVAVFSHPDMDHIGGFLDVLLRYKVDVALEPGASSTNGVWDDVERLMAQRGTAHLLARQGMTIDMGDGVQADILYPDRDMTNMETNSASIVLRIHYGDTAFLLSGDLPSNLEEYVAGTYGSNLHSQVLKLGHHGSRTSSSGTWLAAVHPDIAVVSAGLNNRYGHPHKEVLAILNDLSIPYLGTFKESSIKFESDGMSVVRR